jgi:hypothetical protein
VNLAPIFAPPLGHWASAVVSLASVVSNGTVVAFGSKRTTAGTDGSANKILMPSGFSRLRVPLPTAAFCVP